VTSAGSQPCSRAPSRRRTASSKAVPVLERIPRPGFMRTLGIVQAREACVEHALLLQLGKIAFPQMAAMEESRAPNLGGRPPATAPGACRPRTAKPAEPWCDALQSGRAKRRRALLEQRPGPLGPERLWVETGAACQGLQRFLDGLAGALAAGPGPGWLAAGRRRPPCFEKTPPNPRPGHRGDGDGDGLGKPAPSGRRATLEFVQVPPTAIDAGWALPNFLGSLKR